MWSVESVTLKNDPIEAISYLKLSKSDTSENMSHVSWDVLKEEYRKKTCISGILTVVIHTSRSRSVTYGKHEVILGNDALQVANWK